MPAPPGANPANQTCFTCAYFDGLMGLKAQCRHPRCIPIHEKPEAGCSRWGFAPEADRSIWTCEDWHVAAGQHIPGYVEACKLEFTAPPLYSSDVRRHFERAPEDPRGACRAIALDLARERDLDVRIYDCLQALAREPKMPMQARVYLRRLAQRLMEQPAVLEELHRRFRNDQALHRDSDVSAASFLPPKRRP